MSKLDGMIGAREVTPHKPAPLSGKMPIGSQRYAAGEGSRSVPGVVPAKNPAKPAE